MGKSLIIKGADFSENALTNKEVSIPFVLTNGFCTPSPGGPVLNIDNDEAANLIRVRTGEMSGSYRIKTKPGYVIRAIAIYDSPATILSGGGQVNVINPIVVQGVQGLTEYTLHNPDGYSIVTLCKSDATEEISASEDIVDSIVRVSGKDQYCILSNGFANASSSTAISIDSSAASNLIRVRTTQIYGTYRVETNPGYVIRAIITYNTGITIKSETTSYSSTGAASVSNVQGVTSYTQSEGTKYSIITFCKTDATQQISASEDIVASFERL